MNKKLYLFFIPIITLLVIILCILSLSSQLSFPLTNAKGDFTAMKGMEYEIHLHINDYSNNGDYLTIRNKDGNISHDVKHYQNQLNDANEETLSFYETISIGYNEDNKSKRCKITKEEITSAPVEYVGTLYQGNRASSLAHDENGEELPFLKTDLKYQPDFDHKFYKVTTDCKKEGYISESHNEDIYIDTTNGDSYKVGNLIQQKYDHQYYLMPETDVNIVGQNYIYKMKVIKDETQKQWNRYKAETKPWIQLPEEYYYDSMKIIQGKIIVSAYDARNKEAVFLKYNLKGELLDKMTTDILSWGNAMYFINNNYLIVEMDNTAMIIDVDRMQLMQSVDINIMKENYYVSDMIYQNQRLYCLFRRAGNAPSILSDYLLIKDMNGNTLFEADQELVPWKQLKEDSKQIYLEEKMYIYNEKFKRGEGA